MKVDYEKFPDIPPGCHLNYNKAADAYQVFREERVTDEATGKRRSQRISVGHI
ncbi:MAG: hypothetical protein HUK26_08645, partial [Duodenibacillus sp.]|nr:hypothetical protein [Duodenibacillus sp.]